MHMCAAHLYERLSERGRIRNMHGCNCALSLSHFIRSSVRYTAWTEFYIALHCIARHGIAAYLCASTYSPNALQSHGIYQVQRHSCTQSFGRCDFCKYGTLSECVDFNSHKKHLVRASTNHPICKLYIESIVFRVMHGRMYIYRYSWYIVILLFTVEFTRITLCSIQYTHTCTKTCVDMEYTCTLIPFVLLHICGYLCWLCGQKAGFTFAKHFEHFAGLYTYTCAWKSIDGMIEKNKLYDQQLKAQNRLLHRINVPRPSLNCIKSSYNYN